MTKRNYKEVLDEAKRKAIKRQHISIPGKFVAFTPEEFKKNFGIQPTTAIEVGPDSPEIEDYYNALEHALERGDLKKLVYLLDNEIEIPVAYLPILKMVLLKKAPAGSRSKFTTDEKIRLCYVMYMQSLKEGISLAKVFDQTALNMGVDLKTIERIWNEVNIVLAPAPGVKKLNRRPKKQFVK